MIDTRYDSTKVIAFKYLWYKSATDEHWLVSGGNLWESSRYRHRSDDPETFLADTSAAVYGGIDGFACSNWTNSGDDAFGSESTLLSYIRWLESKANPYPDFKVFVMYELEQGASDPTAAQILAMWEYHRANKFFSPNYMKHRALKKLTGDYVDAPMFAVYATGSSARADVWLTALLIYEAIHPGETIYLCLEIWTNFQNWNNKNYIDCYFKYSPAGDATYCHSQCATVAGNFTSITVMPGFKGSAASPNVTRSLANYTAAVDVAKSYVNCTAVDSTLNLLYTIDIVFISTFDEMGESSGVCESPSFPDASDGRKYSAYLEVTRNAFGPVLVNRYNVCDGG